MESTARIDPQKEQAGGTQQERSTVSFPYSDLDQSIEVVRGVHNAGGTACDSDQLAAQLKMEAKGGGFRMRINSAQTFGLITYERGGRVALTETGRQLLDPSSERQARVNAFLAVALYSKVYEEFKGGPLPPQAGLERAIGAMGVGPKVRDRARQVLLRSAKQAGFFEAAPDRLVKPSIVRGDAGGAPQGQQSGAGEGAKGGSGTGTGATGGGPPKHPLIDGLLVTLPEPGTPWSVSDRMNWLTMANSIFKAIYKITDAGDVEIKLASTKESLTNV